MKKKKKQAIKEEKNLAYWVASDPSYPIDILMRALDINHQLL